MIALNELLQSPVLLHHPRSWIPGRMWQELPARLGVQRCEVSYKPAEKLQKSEVTFCLSLAWPLLWGCFCSGIVSVLVLSSGTKSRGFLATSYFLWKPFHKKLALRFCWGRVCVMALEWRPGKYKGKISVSVPSPHFLHQLTSLVSVWDRGQQGYEISWSGRQLSAVLWLWV